jgi:hypothetical protein
VGGGAAIGSGHTPVTPPAARRPPSLETSGSRGRWARRPGNKLVYPLLARVRAHSPPARGPCGARARAPRPLRPPFQPRLAADAPWRQPASWRPPGRVGAGLGARGMSLQRPKRESGAPGPPAPPESGSAGRRAERRRSPAPGRRDRDALPPRGCRGLMVKASGWQSFDRQFEAYPARLWRRPRVWPGMPLPSDGGIQQ